MKKHSRRAPSAFQIRGLLDLITMQLKVELRSRGGLEIRREELSRTLYDSPRRLEEGQQPNGARGQDVELRKKRGAKS